MKTPVPCKRCNGERWVCEFHPDNVIGHDVNCYGAATPCPDCNTNKPPRLPPNWQSIKKVH